MAAANARARARLIAKMTGTTDEPLVSVVIPAHNSEATLAETLASALASTHRNLQVIIVDDGSTDGTAALVEEFMRRDDRVELHRRGRGGLSAASNSGLAAARGDFVARLDSDDLWHPAKIAKQVELARRDPDAALVYTFLRCIDARSRLVEDVRPQCFSRHALCRGIYESLVGANSSALIRRSVFEAIGGYDEALPGRQDLLLQLQINARYPIAFVPEFLVGYRIRPGSLSSDPATMLDSWRLLSRRLDALFPQVPRFVRNWGDARVYLEAAEGFAWRRQRGAAASLLAQALAKDPLRSALYLGYRSRRHLKKRLLAGPSSADPPLFLDCDPVQPLRRWNADGWSERALRSLDERRFQRLAGLDARLAEARQSSGARSSNGTPASGSAGTGR